MPPIVAIGKNWVVDSETPAGLAGQTLHQMFCGELHRHATAANSRWSRPKMSEEARWTITLGGLYYGVLPKASHGELCPSPFVVIDLEPAPTQRAGIYHRAVGGCEAGGCEAGWFLHGIALEAISHNNWL